MATPTGYLSAIALSSAIVFAGAVWLWSDEMEIEGKLFVGLLLTYALMGVLLLVELIDPTRGIAVWVFGLHNAATLVATLLIFLFAVVYTGRDYWLSRPALAVLFGWLLLLGGLEATNPLHHLVWAQYEIVGGAIPHLDHVPTLLFLILINGSPLLYFAALALFLHRFLTAQGVSRRQTVALFVGFLPPTVSFALWASGDLVGPLSGAIVLGSVWTFGFVGWATYRYRLFDLAPLARETVFEELDDPVIVVDDDLHVLDYNQTAGETFPTIAERQGPRLDAVVPELVDRGEDGPLASRFSYYDGDEPREFSVTTSTLRSAGEEVRGYAVVVSDVTERQEQVRELERQTAQLERFASTLSHDLRNPLNVAQARVRGAMASGSTEDLDSADRALDRVYEMIEDLLTLAREGRTIDDPVRVRLVQVFRDAWATTDTGEATYEVGPGADVVLFADPTRLQNVFENLIRNAIQHGGADVAIALGRHDDGFYVEDDGAGVPEEHREDVFDFDYSTHSEGTGLGLAIVEAIAQAHGWEVEMAEGSDGGARIVFSGVDVVEEIEPDPEPVTAD